MFTQSNIEKYSMEEIQKTFGEEYSQKVSRLSTVLGMQTFTLCYIIKELYDGELRLQDFIHLGQEIVIELSELYDEYSKKVREINDYLNQLTDGRAGKLVDGKVIYDDDNFTCCLGNIEIRTIEDIMLQCEFLGIDAEYRVAHNVGDALMTELCSPRYSRFMGHEEGLLWDKIHQRLNNFYEELLIDNGYDLEQKAKELGGNHLFVYYGCEKYDFPEQFAANDSKLVLAKEDALKLLQTWKEEIGGEGPYLRIDFNHEDGSCTIVLNQTRLDECKKSGFAFSYPKLKSVLLKPDYFQTHNGKEIEEDGKKRFAFYIF